MAITIVIRDDISEAGPNAPLLNDVVRGSVDFIGRPAYRSKSGCWKSAFFLIAVVAAEEFASFGVSSNLISYLTGPLGQSTAAAAENINAWSGTASLMPLLGAFVADSYLGRYRTIIIASLLYILGLGLLSISAVFHSINAYNCKNYVANTLSCSPPQFEVVAFFISLYLVAFAAGGHMPCLQAFGADQFDEEDKKESIAKSSFFNWWYFTMTGGILIALLVLSYIQENLSWELGFGIPCIVMCFTLVILWLGSKTYRFRIKGDERNSFVRIFWVFVKATRNWQATPVVIPVEEEAQSHEGSRFKFLEKAIYRPGGSEEDEKHCSKNDIEDAKAILRLTPIWFSCLGFGIITSQVSTLFTMQGATMDRYITHGFQIPAASLQSLICICIMIFVPIYDCILVPVARTITGKPAGISTLLRIGIGLFFSSLCMVVAAIVERRRLATAVEYGLVEKPNAVVPMSVWWLAPQYLLYGISSVLAGVGLQEFFYDQVPGGLKSIGLALSHSIFGIGCFLSSFLISIIEKVTSRDGGDSWFSNNLNRAHLDHFYWLLAGISMVTMGAYYYFTKSYIYKKEDNK